MTSNPYEYLRIADAQCSFLTKVRMSTPISKTSRRFFAAFHRYLSSASNQPISNSIASTRPRHHRGSHTQRWQTTSTKPHKESLRPQTHYELFPQTIPDGPPPQGPFDIDPRRLRKEFLQLQAKAHPDRHQGQDKARAEGASALINEAYKTLQNPLLRTQYLLSLRGIDVAEDETAKVEDPELLMEVLEMRENIEAAKEATELEPMKRENEEKVKRSVKVIDQAFKSDDIDAAKQEAIKLRYWINIKESLDAWEKGKPVVLIH